ncbi:MAG TPA: sigma-54 dependent transcriptional regulator [Gemmatimonadaceae bacterium]|nr:sigma-54 dependent transcriptional regulator [Gemmatimonadaceae bacterium]
MDDARIRILIADPHSSADGALDLFLGERGFQVTRCADGRTALDALGSETFDVALLDVALLGAAFRDGGALEALRSARGDQAPCEVVLLADPGTPHLALDGEYDQLVRPYRLALAEAVARRAWMRRRLVLENVLLRAMLDRSDRPAEMITDYAPMRAVLELVGRVAGSDSAALIAGERGTGKSHLARVMHARSRRAAAPFARIDCAVLRGDELESELFGREYTAASGATSRQLGLLELASAGTVCVENIDALSQPLQGKLLHALELGSFYRTGGTQKAYASPRLIATTRVDLAAMSAEGLFRGDLYYRINAVNVTLPPLRERTLDILPLSRYFLAEMGVVPIPEVGADAVAALESYPWPGNVDELRDVIERSAARAVDGVIRAASLPFAAAIPAPERAGQPAERVALPLEVVERDHIRAVLEEVGWHQGRAAEILGISPKTLYRKIRQFGFQRPVAGQREAP